MNEVGGQAVIEGIMMRSKNKVALAVRNPEGEIIVKKEEVKTLSDKFKFFNYPLVRGVVSLFSAMIIGVKYLTISANIASAIPDENEELTAGEITFTLLFALSIGLFLFILLPTAFSKLFEYIGLQSRLVLNFAEGIVRIFIFLIYVYSISRLDDIEKVFMYHGAEHKTIYAYENKNPLNVENVKKYSRFHPRCGTSFLMFVMVISMLVFSFITVKVWYMKILYKILLMPLIAGLSFEFIRVAGRNINNPLIKLFIKPGLALQILTTREPEDEQIEVAIKALENVISDEAE